MGTLLWEGSPWVLDLSGQDYLRLVVSAVLGITLADTMIASALNRLGASLQALADCVYSPVIALVGLVMFGEHLSAWEMMGGALVVSGVFVGATRTVEIKKPNDLWIGILLAAGAHIIMAIGILMVRDLFREHSLVWVSTFRFVVAGSCDAFMGGFGREKKVKAFVPRVSDAGDLEVYDSDVDSRTLPSDPILGCWIQAFECRPGGYFQSTFNRLHRDIGLSHPERKVYGTEDCWGLACDCWFIGGCDALR
jgi:hypothetical protein